MKIVLQCVYCFEKVTFECDPRVAFETVKQAGWYAALVVGGVRQDVCPECAAKREKRRI